MNRNIVILGLAFGLCSCASTQLPPIDDAYYSPSVENPAPQTTQTTPSTPIIQNTPSAPTTPTTPNTPTTPSSPTSVEYIHVQDTTVTIRIRK